MRQGQPCENMTTQLIARMCASKYSRPQNLVIYHGKDMKYILRTTDR